MSNRVVRINELIQREISDILRRHFQSEAVAITVTAVRIAPDLRDGRVFIAVVGGPEVSEEHLRWLRKRAPFVREELGRRITLKVLPQLTYILDKAGVRGLSVLGALDERDRRDRESGRPAVAPAAAPVAGPAKGPAGDPASPGSDEGREGGGAARDAGPGSRISVGGAGHRFNAPSRPCRS